ncbi:Putative uncharacterized protein [Moritella viscosa]|uniref:hypothetical protein n=1 Tax=Moritella viscosa TaxID=80854 RepID=UPI0009171EA5|nr:hypothetical protein [Moritella viscosa]SGZ07292.1 Putative uncharacterized protein [Moritella viscosa]
MSSKINVMDIIAGHFRTLIHSSSNKLCFADLFTFLLLPLLISIVSVWGGFKFSDQLISLLVNFGAIFTALLLSVLVLVYDQGTKLEDKIASNANSVNINVIDGIKKKLLDQLYYNICYSIVVSVLLIVFCFIEVITRNKIIELNYFDINLDFNRYLIMPIVVFIATNLMLTIVMIVKRMHTVLTAART